MGFFAIGLARREPLPSFALSAFIRVNPRLKSFQKLRP
jgi:hypothetical protein